VLGRGDTAATIPPQGPSNPTHSHPYIGVLGDLAQSSLRRVFPVFCFVRPAQIGTMHAQTVKTVERCESL
jgi:hypothetical protein